MFLLIDLAEHNVIRLSLADEARRIDYQAIGRQRAALQAIEQFLLQEHVLIQELRGLFVVIGAGSFTSSRVAAVIANTVAYVHKIPVMGVTPEQGSALQSLIPEIQKLSGHQYLSPTYSAEAHIGS